MQPQDRYTLTKFNKDAIDAIYVGVKEVAEAVATTLGPRGRNVLLDRGYSTDIIHDGVKVSLGINPEEPFARNGATVLKEATQKMRDECGDGTTACCILTQAILDEALKATASGVNPMTLRRDLERGANKVINKIEKLSTKVKTLEQKIQIATISAEDAELGKIIAETIHKIGDEGILTVEESKALETFVEMQEGMQVDKGYAHPFMITDPERQLSILEDVHVLITDYSLNSIAEIGKFLDQTIFPNTKKVFFIAPEIGIDFMQVLLGAKMSGQFLGVAMRAPGIASVQTEILQDLCALTGATLITKEAGMKFDDQPFSVLGHAHRIVSSKISTVITNGAGHKEDILQRIAVIRKQMIDETISDWEQGQLEARLAKLTNGVAVIKVGGQTEIEMKERKERVDDARCATQSACKTGFVPGGEIIYLSVLDQLDDNILGERILKEALKAPFKRLVENAGYDSGEKLAELKQQSISFASIGGVKRKSYSKFPKGKPFKGTLGLSDMSQLYNEILKESKGFDVVTGEFKDFIKSGIIDPTGVSTTAIRTAVSVSTQLFSLGAASVLKNEEKK